MATVNICKPMGLILATGAMTNGATQVTSVTNKSGVNAIGVGRNITITITSSTDECKSYRCRVTAESVGSTIDVNLANPFAT